MKKGQVVENITIESLASSGKGVGKKENQVIFVDKVAPGDVVDVKINKAKKNFLEATPVEFHEKSKMRADPFCEHFGLCGGCKWQHINYEEQLKQKEAQVAEALARIGKLDVPEIEPIIGAPEIQFYRNKLEFTFSNKRWLTSEEVSSESRIERNGLGFHIPNRYDRIVDVNKCFLQPEPSNLIRDKLREFAISKQYTFYDHYRKHGFLRGLIVRTASTGDVMVLVQFAENNIENIREVMDFLAIDDFKIDSLNYVINQKGNDTFNDLEVICYRGYPYITESIGEFNFKIGPKSFFQTNTTQAETMYQIARDFAQLSDDDIVYDLYTGTGTIACFISPDVKKVVGIEYVQEAIDDANENANINGIENTVFYAGDIGETLNSTFVKENGSPNVIFTDPPRAGMHPNVINLLLEISPKKIVYISCNPATQARDLNLLKNQYKIEKVQPIDFFPHTPHVENVVLLTQI